MAGAIGLVLALLCEIRPEDVRMANTWKDQISRHSIAPPALPAA